jgi:hypothetical protein
MTLLGIVGIVCPWTPQNLSLLVVQGALKTILDKNEVQRRYVSLLRRLERSSCIDIEVLAKFGGDLGWMGGWRIG